MKAAQRPAWLSRNVIALGVVSLLTDTATEMIIPLLPVFLTGTLGAGALALGWIEGAADAVASVLKFVSGRWSDRTGRRRPLVILGYSVSSAVRPLVALATAAGHVLAVRVADRVGKGLRSSPRDALIADSVPEASRGTAFGWHRAMDHTGAVLGPLIATAYLMGGTENLRPLFWMAAIPGAMAVTVLFLFVRDVAPVPAEKRTTQAAAPPGEDRLSRLLIPLGLFTLGNASDVFLLLKAGATRAPLVSLPLLWMGLHIVKMLTSVPGGRIADRWGYRRTIAVGWLVYALVYAGFAFADTQAEVWALFIVYGCYHGLTEGPEKALVARVVKRAAWGTGFGRYHLTVGAFTLTASVLFGALWQYAGSQAAFLTSASLALLAVVLLWAMYPRTGHGGAA